MTAPVHDTPLTRAVAVAIDRHGLLPSGPVIVALSGGPDSLCLLHALADLAPRRQWRLVAAHLDHGIRPESADEVATVRALAAARGVPLRAARVDVPALAAARQWSIEQAARVARYRFLAEVAAAEGQAPVATGHTQDDQAETLLLRLARGAGLTGLRAMQPATALPPQAWDGPAGSPALRVVRPLLGVSRAAVMAEVHDRGLQPLHDPSNRDPAYLRNRLRYQLLPAWQALDAGITRRLARAAAALSADEEFLQAETARRWQALNPAVTDAGIAFDRAGFASQPLALQRRLLRHAVTRCRPGLAPRLATINLALAALTRGQPERVHLGGGLLLALQPERLWVGPAGAEPGRPPTDHPWMTPGAHLPVALGEVTTLPGSGWRLRCQRQPATACQAPLSGTHAHFTLALATQPLALRTWQPGDRLVPAGLHGHKKLHDLFIDRKVPRTDRPSIPLLLAGETIAWVGGVAIAEPFRAHAGEPTVICCQFDSAPAPEARQERGDA